MRPSGIDSPPVTHIPGANVGNAGRVYTAPAAGAANAFHATGEVGGVYEYGCRLFKKRVECAIMLKVAEAIGDGQAER